MIGTKASCMCKTCQSYCENVPGWFSPGEVEKVAEFLGISLDELFSNYLMVDWRYTSKDADDSINVLSPAIQGDEYLSARNRRAPHWPNGRCVFLKDGLCSIHPVKPRECRSAWHGKHSEKKSDIRGKIAEEWDTEENQDFIYDLVCNHKDNS